MPIQSALAQPVAACAWSQVLQLQDNFNLGGEGITALASCLVELRGLTSLDLSNCSPGGEGMRQLAQVRACTHACAALLRPFDTDAFACASALRGAHV